MAAPVPQNHYISVFGRTTGMNGENFDPIEFEGNGIAVLTPSKCTITETLNGGYSLTLTHPTDSDNVWKTLYPLNFIKAQGQIFRIQSVETSYDGSSSGNVTIYAEHVTYMMNDAWIFHDSLVCGEWMGELIDKSNAESRPNGDTYWGGAEKRFPNFRYTIGSEMSIPSAYKTETIEGYLNKQYVHDIGEGKTRYQVMMEAIQKFGGELYRDNFYFSIYNRMENSLGGEGEIDAFDIRLGENMLGIKRKVDISNFCSYFQGYSEGSGIATISYGDMSGLMNNIVREKHYHDITDFGILEHETASYFGYHMNPEFTYTLKLKDLRQNPNFRMLSGVRFKVGDIGRIVDERLGLSNNLRLEITQTKTNGITGEVEEITLKSTSEFSWNYGSVKLPKFPELPEKSDKIIVTALNSGTKYYFDDLYTTRQFLDENPNVNYSVKIGENAGVTIIYNNFANATNLKQIEIPETVYGIESAAFDGCSGLEIVHIDGANINFGINSFANCTSLKSINLHENLKNIPEHMFLNCTSLTQISLPEGLEFIRNGAFRGSGLVSVTIPDSVTSIGTENPTLLAPGTFMDCQSLQNVEIGNGLKEIPERCFLRCTALKNVLFHDEVVTAIGELAFSGCSGLKSIALPQSVKYLYGNAFSNCESLATFSCPADLTFIGPYAFSGCSALNKFNFSDALKVISMRAFSDCTSLKKITIPTNVVRISTGSTSVFNGCTNLKKIVIKNMRKSLSGDPWGAPNFISTDDADRLAEQGLPLPAGKHILDWDGAGDEDELADKILLKELNIDGTVKKYNTVKSTGYLKDFLQENPDKLYAVDIGALCIGKEDSPTYATITAESFSGITNLKELYIPDTFRTIEADAFTGCANLDYVQIGGQKGRISGEPWGADSSTEFYYSANLVNLDGATLMAADDIYPYLAVKTQQTNATYETGLSGALKVSAESGISVEKTLYIISENNAFSLKLGDKELTI